MALTDAAVRAAKAEDKNRKLSDGGGLHLFVTPKGGRLWRLNYRYGGKQKTLSFGPYPAVSLADARQRREEAKRQLAAGEDPSAIVRQRKAEVRQSNANTFSVLADEYEAKLAAEGRAPATLSKTKWLLDFARSDLGKRPVAEITPAEVLAVLRRVEARGTHETARRLRSTIGSVFRFAIATDRAVSDPTLALRGALVTPKVRNRAAITDAKAFGGLLRTFDDFDGQTTTCAALKLLVLLFPRPGELRLATWDEFDLDEAVWTIPAERTKTRRAHRKPLSRQVLAILRDLRRLTNAHDYVFPSVRTWKRPMSDNTLNAALRRLGYTKDEATAHGFRATASTLLNESGKWHADAIERELGHIEGNEVRRAYARGEHWEERTRMMQWWADECESLATSKRDIVKD